MSGKCLRSSPQRSGHLNLGILTCVSVSDMLAGEADQWRRVHEGVDLVDGLPCSWGMEDGLLPLEAWQRGRQGMLMESLRSVSLIPAEKAGCARRCGRRRGGIRKALEENTCSSQRRTGRPVNTPLAPVYFFCLMLLFLLFSPLLYISTYFNLLFIFSSYRCMAKGLIFDFVKSAKM